MRAWRDALGAAASYAALSSGFLLILAPSAMASGDYVIPYFLGAIVFTFAFPFVVYQVARRCSRRPGIVALAYFIAVLAMRYLSMSVLAVADFLSILEGHVRNLLPELEPTSFARNFIGAGLITMEIVIPALGIATLAVLLTRQRG
jgi:hypothetical protein